MRGFDDSLLYFDYTSRFVSVDDYELTRPKKKFTFLVYCKRWYNPETLELEPFWVSGFWPGNICFHEKTLNETLMAIEKCASKLNFEFTCILSTETEVKKMEDADNKLLYNSKVLS